MHGSPMTVGGDIVKIGERVVIMLSEPESTQPNPLCLRRCGGPISAVFIGRCSGQVLTAEEDERESRRLFALRRAGRQRKMVGPRLRLLPDILLLFALSNDPSGCSRPTRSTIPMRYSEIRCLP